MENVNEKILEITGNEDNGFLMYVDGNMMWFCETRQDVYDQIQYARDTSFFDESVLIPVF